MGTMDTNHIFKVTESGQNKGRSLLKEDNDKRVIQLIHTAVQQENGRICTKAGFLTLA
jgi:hypothetical protein